MKKVCPFCQKEVKALGKHLLHCKHIPKSLSKDEIKIIGIESYAGKNFLPNLINDYTINNFSLPEIREKYGIDLKNICWLLHYKGIKIRSISESAHLIVQPKIKNTLQKRYGEGIINVGQIPEVKEKVKNTFIKHYGYTNIWKTPEYAQFTSNRWATMDPEKKKELLHKWQKNNNGRISNLELKIVKVFIELNIPIQTQYYIKNYYHAYDIYLTGTNIIIEVNGDFWHANPKIYKENDMLNFPKNKKLAKDVWEHDMKNIKFAENKGYKVIIFWETDINNANDLKLFVANSIFSYIK